MFVIRSGKSLAYSIQRYRYVDIKMIPLKIMDWTGADMTVLQTGNWNIEEVLSLHSVSLWILEWQWHIIMVSEQKSFLPLFSPSKTSTGPLGAQGRWLQIDNHQYSLSWLLDLLLSSFPNYLIMYRKLFINVFHLQQFAQVINYFESLSISNDWFPLWYTLSADSLSHTGALLYIKCWSIFYCSEAINEFNWIKTHHIKITVTFDILQNIFSQGQWLDMGYKLHFTFWLSFYHHFIGQAFCFTLKPSSSSSSGVDSGHEETRVNKCQACPLIAQVYQQGLLIIGIESWKRLHIQDIQVVSMLNQIQ